MFHEKAAVGIKDIVGRFARKRGGLSSQRRSDELQRSANAQPGGIDFGFGTMPGMAVSRRRGPSIGGFQSEFFQRATQ